MATLTVLTDANIFLARDSWFNDQATAISLYGEIARWNTSSVTNMAFLFCASEVSPKCNVNGTNFNINISLWDTTSVTSMKGTRLESSPPAMVVHHIVATSFCLCFPHATNCIKHVPSCGRAPPLQECFIRLPHLTSRSYSTRATSRT